MGKVSVPLKKFNDVPRPEPDWEQRRYEIAKDILVRLITHSDWEIRNEWSRMKSQYIKDAIESADMIIKELKETKK